MTNLGVIYALTKEGDIIFSDQLNHASIIDGSKISKAKVKVYKHKDSEDLENLIKEELNEIDKEKSKNPNFFIVSDGVFSMDGDIAPLPELVEIANEYNCCLIIDDAHATGVIGKTGRGTVEYFKDKTGKDGVEEIPAVGEKFDPFKHEALLTVDSPDHENNEIVDELMKGYTLKDKVIKYSKVRVCKKAKKVETEDKEE